MTLAMALDAHDATLDRLAALVAALSTEVAILAQTADRIDLVIALELREALRDAPFSTGSVPPE